MFVVALMESLLISIYIFGAIEIDDKFYLVIYESRDMIFKPDHLGARLYNIVLKGEWFTMYTQVHQPLEELYDII